MTAASVTASSASASDASADSTTWLYIDDDGVQRGPFSSAQMAAWFDAGYFSPDQLCKRIDAKPPSATPPLPSGSASASASALATPSTDFRAMSSCFPPAMRQSQQQKTAHASGRGSDVQVASEAEQHSSATGTAPEAAATETDAQQVRRTEGGTKVPAGEHVDENGGEERKERQGQDELLDEDELEYDEEEDEDEEAEDPEVAARLAALKGSAQSEHSSPAHGASAADNSARASGGEHSWHYEDDSGAVQGPFPTSHMRAWHAAGYFKPHTRVRRDDESELAELQHRAHTDFTASPSTAATVHAAAPASSPTPSPALPPAPRPSFKFYTPSAGETDWYYTDRSGIERGPFSSSLMRHWHSAGYLTFNDCPVRAAHMPPSASAPLRLQTSPPDFVLPPHHTAATGQQQRTQASEQWLYIDSSGQQQGPFSTVAMAQWWRAGYLPPDTRVARAGEQQWSSIADRGAHCSFVQQSQRQTAVAGMASSAHHYYSNPT